MRLDSVIFLSCFLPALALLSCIVRGTRPKNILLLIAGLVFCAFGGLSGLLVLLVTAAVNYLLALLIRARETPCRAAVAAAVVLDLAALVFYKYLDLLLSLILSAQRAALSGAALAAPIGISFFTFKCISYVVDVYRDRKSCVGGFFAFLLYVSFFPQITAGPIARARDFLPQLEHRSSDPDLALKGMQRYIVGMAKKLLLSAAAAKIADAFFAADAALDARSAWLGAIAFMLQIYFDFSAYSDMAIGLGNLFGFETPENFDRPYLAVSLTDFWRRWHISLSSWFRDYLYIPLGGSRKGRARAIVNKLIVFALSGLWHGAAWTFLLWGLWHGILVSLETLRVIDPAKLRDARGARVLGRCYTLLAVCFGFVLFRADGLPAAWRLLSAMFGASPLTAASSAALLRVLNPVNVFLLLLGAAVVPLESLCPPAAYLAPAGRAPRILSCAVCLALLVLCVAALSAGGFAPFIYAQF